MVALIVFDLGGATGYWRPWNMCASASRRFLDRFFLQLQIYQESVTRCDIFVPSGTPFCSTGRGTNQEQRSMLPP